MGRSLVALLLLCTAAPCALAREPLAEIDACLARLDPASDIGYAQVTARCPDLPAALSQSSIAAWLPADWSQPENQLSAAGLTELRQLIAQGIPRERRPALHVEHVAKIVASIAPAAHASSSLFERLRQWLRRILQPPPQDPEGSWVWRLMRHDLSARAAKVLNWSVLGLIVALALGIVVNELRLAGLLRPREARGPATPAAAGAAEEAQAIEAAALSEQPRLLLEQIARRLSQQQRLPPARALTARELAARARLPDEAARASLAELATVTERVRFSGREVPPPLLTAALAGGRRLLEALAAGAVARSA